MALLPLELPEFQLQSDIPEQMTRFPRFRYMGSKFRLFPWLHETFQGFTAKEL